MGVCPCLALAFLAALPSWGGADLDGSGRVDGGDLLLLIESAAAADIDGDGYADHRDLFAFAAAWYTPPAPSYTLEYDHAGDTLRVRHPDGRLLVRINPMLDLAFTDGARVSSGAMARSVASQSPLVLAFSHARVSAWVQVREELDRIVLSGTVECKTGAIMHIALPYTFHLEGGPVSRMLWPRALGVELLPPLLSSSRTESADYPGADGFCDFVAADLSDAPVYFYRCGREERARPVTFLLHCGPVPQFRRFYRAYVGQGQSYAVPPVACQIGGPLRNTLLRYKRQCGLGRTLADKLSPAVWEDWAPRIRSVLDPPFALAAESLSAFTHPAVVEPWAWMLGGFDRKYPDFLPPNPVYGGETEFRTFVSAAHNGDHLVQLYTNFTWWCTGWEGEGSEPAPSYLQYGDVALSRSLSGQLYYENYEGNYGYRNTPLHPVANAKRAEVRNALLSDYGIDLLYHDQLGARSWDYDANPAHANPSDYGDGLMQIGRQEAARGRPVGTETGHDRALEWASLLNYWTYPPLAPLLFWPNTSLPGYWKPHEARVYPYALHLSGGDAILDLHSADTSDRLAWALLLNARLSILGVNRNHFVGAARERLRFAQELQKVLPARALSDRLLAFDYLADRILAATYEKHRVLANFSGRPYTLPDELIVAASGFDLRAHDGFLAGEYLSREGVAVALFRLPGSATAGTLARGDFTLPWGGQVLAATHPVLPATSTRASVLAFPVSPGAVFAGGQTPESVLAAFSALAPQSVTSPLTLDEALARSRVLVNPYSEYFPAASLSAWPAGVDRLRTWCEAGGILVEIGGYPAYTAAAWDGAAWRYKSVGAVGLRGLCDEACSFAPDVPTTLSVTSLGGTIFSKATLDALDGTSARVLRPPASTARALVLCESSAGAYLVVHRTGHGALVRVGGVPTPAAMAALPEIVAALLDGRLPLAPPLWRMPFYREVVVGG